jgi:transposase InsO family protein
LLTNSKSQRIHELVSKSHSAQPETQIQTKRNIITFSWTQVGVCSDQVSMRIAAESTLARSICLPIVINGAPAGPALVDQGATRSVMRLSAYDRIKSHMHKRAPLKEVFNMYVVGSTNELVPVVGVFVADIYTTAHQHICDTVIYVADDMNGKDIVCDLILGRSSIAISRYSSVDTRHTGALVSLDGEHIKCFRGEFEADEEAKSQLTITDNDEPDTQFPLAQVDLHKLRALTAVVSERDKLNDEQKGSLIDQLLTGDDAYDARYATDQAEVAQLFATFIPSSVRKSLHTQSDDTQSQRTVETTDEVAIDDVEFPYTPVTRREDSPEYHAAKRAKIDEMIMDNPHLSTKQKDALKELLQRHSDRFSMKGENMERTDSVQHEIDTGDARPFRERLRQYAPAVQKIIDDEVQQMLKDGVITQSKSPYASNLLLVRKADPTAVGGVKNRVCASFVQLNKQTVKDSYPLPNIQYIFDKIGRSKWFTTMDLLSGFWQVLIKPEHRHKTAFITMRGLYEFAVMAFGLCNAPGTFQRLMDHVILPEYRDFIETYIDDLMTHSSSFEDHLKHLDVLLTNLREHKLVVKLSKCKFAQREVKFLGHLISFNNIKTNPESVAAIVAWHRPAAGGAKAVTAVRSFLGMAGWYRKFIPDFASIAKPLFQLTKKDAEWEWTKECQSAFEKVRDALVSKPVLAVADPNKPYVLHTDASDHAMGAILMQEDENGEARPIAYASKTFNDAQRNYDTTEREALAIVWALQHFNTYCEGHKYTLLTDHAALSFIRSNTNASKRIYRWQVLLQGYDLQIQYQPGKDNHAADLLSRDAMVLSQSPRVNVVTAKVKASRRKNSINKGGRVSSEEYVVEKIIDRRAVVDGDSDEFEYFVKWKDYPDSDNTWEPLSNLSGAADLLSDYERARDAVVQPRTETLSVAPDKLVCDLCTQEYMNESSLHVHRFQEHKVQVPTDRLAKLDITTDIDVYRKLQQLDSDFREVFNTDLGTEGVDTLKPHHRKMMLNNEFVLSENGLLYMIEYSHTRARSRVHTQLRLCVPKTERRRLMYQYHDGCAHPGVIHLYDKLREYVWWPRMLTYVCEYVRQCHECQKVKGERAKYLARPMSLPDGPWTHVAIDHIGPFPMTNGGYKYILVIVDRFTRYAEAVPCADESAATTANIFIDHIICRYGFPLVLLSDRGSGFTSILFTELLKILGVKKIKTMAYHPKSNGGVEIVNKTLKKTLKMWVNEHHNDWDVLLPYAIFSYNTSVHSTVHETPFYLNTGRQARTAVDAISRDELENYSGTHGYARELAEKLHKVHTRVREIYSDVNERRAEAIDNGQAREVTYAPGDRVWLYDPTTPIKRSKKLVKRWLGPYVLVRLSNNNLNATIMKNDRQMTVNVDRIRPYDRGIMSIEDQHKRDIQLAEDELSAINGTISELHRKKRQLILEQQVSTAGVAVEQSQTQQVNGDDEHKYPEDEDPVVSAAEDGPVTVDLDDDDHHQDDTDVIHNHSVIFQEDDVDSTWDATSLTSMDLILLW